MGKNLKIKDVLGIGFGPANIALAALFDEEATCENFLFLEAARDSIWQPEMLFKNALDIHSDVQNIPHRDLATLRSPRSKYTFMNYLNEQDLLLQHLNMDLLLPMRPDFANYVAWVAEELSDHVRHETCVTRVSYEDGLTPAFRVDTAEGCTFYGRSVVVGTGREPNIPEPFADVMDSDRVFHLSRYNSGRQALLKSGAKKIAVIGSSQSAVEILLHLDSVAPELEIHSIIRRFAYPLKDTNPFMSEVYFPEFTDFFYEADPKLKSRVNRDVHRTNYGGSDMDVLQELYRRRYYSELQGGTGVNVRRMTEVRAAEAVQDGIRLTLFNAEQNEVTTETFDGVFLGTGFRNIGAGENDVRVPWVLEGLRDELALDSDGCVQIDRNYRVQMRRDLGGAVVLNGQCEASHGVSDGGSLSLLSLRAVQIADTLSMTSGIPADISHQNLHCVAAE